MKKIIVRILTAIGIAILTLIAFVVIGTLAHRADLKTPAFTDGSGRVLKNSVALCEMKTINGWPQYLLMRGRDSSLPVLLFLHGGPGSPETGFLRSYNADLENHFIMVYWDQRGAGRTYSPFMDKKTMTIEQFVDDTHELIRYLKKKFGRDRIFLAGHSWGSFLGAQVAARYPEDLYCYIGIGQVVDLAENERLSYNYAYGKAVAAKDRDSIETLDSIKGYPEVEDLVAATMTQRQVLMKYGGVIRGESSYLWLFGKVNNPESSMFDVPVIFLGGYESMKALWVPMKRFGDLRKKYISFKIPVYLFTGKYDYNVPFALSEDYFRKLSAPRKELIWFDTAHFLPTEDPKGFNAALISIKDKMVNR